MGWEERERRGKREERSPQKQRMPGSEFLSPGSHGADPVEGEERLTWRCVCVCKPRQHTQLRAYGELWAVVLSPCSQHWLRARYCAEILHFHLILTSLWARCCYYSHFKERTLRLWKVQEISKSLTARKWQNLDSKLGFSDSKALASKIETRFWFCFNGFS